MAVYQCRKGRSLGLLAGAAFLAICLLSGRQTEPSEDAVTVIRAHLQPTFSSAGARSPYSPPDLSLKEALEARVLALRAHCERKEKDGETLQHKQSKLESALRRQRGQLAWCAHPLTMDTHMTDKLERLADENSNTEIRIDRDNYFSMPEVEDGGDRGTAGMAWHIVEHPLLVLTRAYLELRDGHARWPVPAGQRTGPAVSLAEVLELAVTDDPLPPAADTCAVCNHRYDFVLHAAELDTEVAFLASEMGWRNTWRAPTESADSRETVVRELARQLPLVPRHLLRRVKQRFRRDLSLYGFRMELDTLLEAAQ
ncbi:hypothetical protein FJT64_012220 [Amphibalanus amphitrite]|uniref:Carbohydrate sulfotransferase n=1 Tax=Amphibalanus amphitrite TaxID=1232801 RepID=A0A6A4VDF1_AMPAM|nr:hypothetical protein FJT64_012220 [Amphibalanus amphitrite]